MAKQDPSKDPSTVSAAYEAMAPQWRILNATVGGTLTMREAGEVFLPKHDEEGGEAYKNRLAATVFYNMVEQTLDTISGKPFSEPVKRYEIPKDIDETFCSDVDLLGNNLDVFARKWFREGMLKGFAHVLVEFPRIDKSVPRTLDDDRREGVRPYLVLVQPESLIFARGEIVAGKEVLKHIRISETYTEQEGFADITKPQIRILEPGNCEIWRQDPTDTDKWYLYESFETGIDSIPLVTFYADREGALMLAKPPLLDLAYLNVEHWQSSSDQRNVLTVSRFPILAASGSRSGDSDKITVGPRQILYNPDPAGKFYYVEHTGAAIAAGRMDMQDIETRMQGYGAEFLRRKPGNPTATGRAIDAAEATSDLAAMAACFVDAFNTVMDLVAERYGVATAGYIDVVRKFDIAVSDQVGVTALTEARRSRDISRVAFLNELKSRGVLAPTYDAEADAELIEEEAAKMDELTGQSGKNLDPLAPGEDKNGLQGKEDPEENQDEKIDNE